MSKSKMDGAESATGWTTANLLKLVRRIRRNTPESENTTSCLIGVLSVNWDKTAFPPYSAKECHDEWQRVMDKMRKFRSLSDLIAEAEEVVSKPLLHKRIHPDFPKPPRPAKIVFIREHASRLKRMYPKLAMSEITVMAHKKYDELPDEKKEEYIKKHALECVEYWRKFQNFCKDNNISCPQKSKRERLSAIICAGLPMKPPLNGLCLFMKENAAENRPSLGSNFLNDMRKRWKRLNAAEKQDYCTRCLKMKHEYNANLKEYLDRFDETEKQRIIKEQDIRLMMAKPLSMSPREPKMPSQTLLTYFARDQRMSSAKSKKRWDKLPTKEKERYKEQMRSNMKQYSEKLQKWFQNLTPQEQTKYLKRKPSKLKFLDAKQKQVYDREELHLSQPSDSEDEDITDITSEDDSWCSYEDESGEDWDMFAMHR